MEKNYRYVLGIDLGISSIGTALFNVTPHATDLNDIEAFDCILDAGVRICSVPLGAAERRGFRLQRVHKRHKKIRKQKLVKLLQEYGLLPLDTTLIELGLRSQPYALRAYGMKNVYDNPYKLGYALLHLSRFRGAGFIDEEIDNDDISPDLDISEEKSKKKETKTTSRYKDLELRIKNLQIEDSSYTLSEFLSKHLKENGCVRQRLHLNTTKVPFSIPRYLVKNDFYALIKQQASAFNISEEQVTRIYNEIFKDFPRAPYANGKCMYNSQSGEERLPKMHRLSEIRRMYEQVNNLRYTSVSDVTPQQLNKEIRDLLIEILMKGEGLNKTKVKKVIVDWYKENGIVDKILTVNIYEVDKEISSIKGFAHVKAFANISYWHNLSEQEQDKIIEFIADPINPDAKDSLYDEDTFITICKERLQLLEENGEQALYACINSLPKDRTKLGKTATLKIIEKLKDGVSNEDGIWQAITISKAAELCNYTHSSVEFKEKHGTYDMLPYYGEVLSSDTLPIHPWHIKNATKEEQLHGRIPNPVVHVILNQLRKVVNEITELYGQPEMIKVELARDFGLSAKKREELENERKNNTKENIAINAELQKYGYAPNSKNRKKYKLWKQQGEKDIYSLQDIRISDLASCEIDHIIPQSAGGASNMSNSVLTFDNREKTNIFAYDFIAQNYPEKWDAIQIELKKLPKEKSWRFMPTAKAKFQEFGDEDNTDHRLQDTRYMSKLAHRYLSLLCKNVLTIKGGITAQMRGIWGLNGIEFDLMGLSVPRDYIIPETGEVLTDIHGNIAQNPDWEAKPRIDHRHHAIDAMVLCGITRVQVQKLSRYEKLGTKINMDIVPAPFTNSAKHPNESFRSIVFKASQKIKISHKQEHCVNGALHNQTAIRILDYDEKKNLYATFYKRALSNLDSFASLNKIAVEEKFGDTSKINNLREKCQSIIDKVTSKKEEAQVSLAKRNQENMTQGFKESKISDSQIFQEAVRLAQVPTKYPEVANTSLVNIRHNLQCGYKPDSNACVVFYEVTEGKDKGKIAWECQTTFDTAQSKKTAQWEQNGKLIWKVYKGDILELKLTSELITKYEIPLCFVTKVGENQYSMLVKILNFSKNRVIFVSTTDARALLASPTKQIKDNFMRWTSDKGLIFYTQSQARKVDISPFGKIMRKHRKLWHGKKTKNTS